MIRTRIGRPDRRQHYGWFEINREELFAELGAPPSPFRPLQLADRTSNPLLNRMHAPLKHRKTPDQPINRHREIVSELVSEIHGPQCDR